MLLGLTDLLYALGSAHTKYTGGHLLKAGWFPATSFMALASGRVDHCRAPSAARSPSHQGDDPAPYAALVVATSTAVVHLLTGHNPGLVELALICLLVGHGAGASGRCGARHLRAEQGARCS